MDGKECMKTVEFKDDAHLKKYTMWENKSTLCWLDASMALVAHNKVMEKYYQVSPESRISKIISEYGEEISVLNNPEKNFNHRVNLARGKLTFIQTSTLRYLQPILRYKMGDLESAFCSLYNVLIEDSCMKAIFDITWQTHKECSDCKNFAQSTKKQSVIALSKIDSFNPENPAVLYHCPCNKSLQKIKLSFIGLLPCLIFHFESGVGKECPPLSFSTRGREYQLTGIMTLEKSQDSKVCNDVYTYVYESFDYKGTITVSKIEHNISTKTNETIPCIDLSESDSENSNYLYSILNKCIEPSRDKFETTNFLNNINKDIKKMEKICAFDSQLHDNVTSEVSDRDKSLEVEMSSDNMQTFTLDRQITQKDFLQSLKTAASTSGTSYVKLSVRKKKSRSVPLRKKSSIIEINNPDSEESTDIYAPSCSKCTQETRVPKRKANEGYIPSGVSKKKYARISNVEKNAINTKEGAYNSKAKVKVLKTGLKRSQVRSKLKNFTNNKIPRVKRITSKVKDMINKEHERSNIDSLNCSQEDPQEPQLFSEQCRSTASENEKIPSDDEEGICVMEEFKDLWLDHEPGCHCDDATLEEEIDAVVDFTFAYICQLGMAMSKYH